jgi:hypothetical protein
MSTVRGKLVTIAGQRRFFTSISGNPAGALDSRDAHHDARDRQTARDAELDDREAALDAREAAEDEGKEDAEACDRRLARDARAIARHRRASARDRRTEDALPDNTDHRRDFDPSEPTARERADAYERARDRGADSRRGMAQDRAADVSLASLWPEMP